MLRYKVKNTNVKSPKRDNYDTSLFATEALKEKNLNDHVTFKLYNEIDWHSLI